MNIPNTGVTPLGVASLAITAVFAPLVAWLTRNAGKLLKRYNVLSAKVTTIRTDLDLVTRQCADSDRRIIRLEEALVEIKGANQRSEAALATISVKLDALPRLEATIQAQASQISKVVPREEVESKLGQYDHRLKLVEQDIRKGA